MTERVGAALSSGLGVATAQQWPGYGPARDWSDPYFMCNAVTGMTARICRCGQSENPTTSV
jgi:hypothetical protein